MTYVKFGVAAVALCFGVSAAGAFEIVDTNNGFAGPAFALSDPDESMWPALLNSDDFADAHINSAIDNKAQFEGYSYSGFTFEDQIDGQADIKQVSQALQDTKSDLNGKTNATRR